MCFDVLFKRLGGQDTSSTNSFNFFFCYPRKESGLHNNWLFWQNTFTEHFEVASAAYIDDGSFLVVLLVFDTGLFRHKGPKLVQIDGRTVVNWVVGMDVEVAHADLSEITWMVFVEVDAVMMLPPAFPRPPGCFLCLPIRPCPWET